MRLEQADPAAVEVLRRQRGSERLAQAFGLWRTTRAIVRSSERRRHPEVGDQALERRVAERMSRGT